MLGVVWRALALVFVLLVVLPAIVLARDPDGNYGKFNPQLHAWFDKLANRQHGMCCSFADGRSVAVDDWGTKLGPDGKTHYWVILDGVKTDVPDNALVDDPNRFGPAVVWPYPVINGQSGAQTLAIRCFMPGAMT